MSGYMRTPEFSGYSQSAEFTGPILPLLSPDSDFDGERRLLGLKIRHNSKLKAAYLEGHGQESDPTGKRFQLWIADEILGLAREKGFGIIRELIASNFQEIEQGPYGERSLDPDKDLPFARRLRTVNGASLELESLIRLPIAIKGSGRDIALTHPDRENLLTQFELMRELALLNSKLKEETTKRIGFCPIRFAQVYLAVSFPTGMGQACDDSKGLQQYLLIEKAPNGRRVENYDSSSYLSINFGGRWLASRPSLPGFFASRDHPRLAAFAGIDSNKVLWTEVKEQLNILGITPFVDIEGRNVLFDSGMPFDEREYVIIDQRALNWHYDENIGGYRWVK